jgi:hypothetical protein
MLLPRTTKPLETSATATPWLPLAGHVVPTLFFILLEDKPRKSGVP